MRALSRKIEFGRASEIGPLPWACIALAWALFASQFARQFGRTRPRLLTPDDKIAVVRQSAQEASYDLSRARAKL
jgi:hypothetical protein